MQSKGAIRFVIIVLALACIYQLSFTAITGIVEKKAENYAQAKADAFDISKVAEADKAYVLDSVKKIRKQMVHRLHFYREDFSRTHLQERKG